MDQENVCDVTDGDRLTKHAAVKRLRAFSTRKTVKMARLSLLCVEGMEDGGNLCLCFGIQSTADLRV